MKECTNGTAPANTTETTGHRRLHKHAEAGPGAMLVGLNFESLAEPAPPSVCVVHVHSKTGVPNMRMAPIGHQLGRAYSAPHTAGASVAGFL